MHESIPCPVCGMGALRAHYEIFAHLAVCQVSQVETLLARERRAKAEAWQLNKKLNRLEKRVHRGVSRIGQGRAGVLTAKRVLDAAKQVLSPASSQLGLR